MAFVVKTAKTIRNNWKKSTFAALVVSYGYGWTKEYFQIQDLMRVYCEKAVKFGEEPIPVRVEPRKVTVILNPSANKRKANDDFESYCAPILHLAGIAVDIIKTESEGHAKTLIDGLEHTDAIVVAGGDGTLSEVVTGLLRRTDENTDGLIPLGILPLGRSNTVSQLLFPGAGKVGKVRAMADAAMAIVEEVIRPIDVLKVEVMEESDSKPIYAVSGIKWGAYRDAESRKDSYWVYGGWRQYAAYLFNGYKSGLTWNCDAAISYLPPCSGCSNCTKVSNHQKKWYQQLVRDQQPKTASILNPECTQNEDRSISTVDFNLRVPFAKNETPKLLIDIGPKSVDYFGFVWEGWRTANGEKRTVNETIEARSIEIKPQIDSTEKWFSIDNENYELKPVKVTLLPKLIKVFCGRNNL